MNILCIDTSSQWCSVALKSAGEIYQKYQHGPRQQAGWLLAFIDEVLSQASLGRQDIQAIGVCVGPGSFTGVRVAIAMAQGLAYGLNCPVVAVSSLAAMAQGVYRQYQHQQVIVAIDARINEIYLSGYEFSQGRISRVLIPEQLTKAKDVYFSADRPFVAVGTGWEVYANDFSKEICPDEYYFDFALQAQDILPIAEDKLAREEVVSPSKLVPTYLRDKVV